MATAAAFAVAACGDDDDDGATPGSGGKAQGGGGSQVGGSGGTGGTAGSGVGGDGGGVHEAGGGGAPDSETGGSGPGAAGAGGAGAAGAGGEAGGVRTGCVFPSSAAIEKASVPEGFCAWQWASGVGEARGITVDSEGNVLVVARGDADVVALWDEDGDGVSSDTERAVIASAPGLNHGIALHEGYLYASSATTVYRWPYTANRMPLGNPETVVTGIPSGGHSTRTLALDDAYLYVSVGSGSNVDSDSTRARIRRFALADLDDGPVAFTQGEVFADGLRNEVGLAFDAQGRLWGVENGRDSLSRADLGGDIHEDNPAEELNLFEEAGRFYGYPYCWTEFVLPDSVGMGAGTQWADPEFMDDGTHTDAWCRDPDNVVPPVLAFQAHSAPLDILFYEGAAFPAEYQGDAIVSLHGSWNRDEPTGYKVVRMPFDDDGMPTGDVVPLLEYAGPGDDAAEWPHRPVGLAVLPSGVLLVTSDASDAVLAVDYAP
nr:MAG: hypothetical protein DIU78_25310 [Pseudomonadota bacterium]